MDTSGGIVVADSSTPTWGEAVSGSPFEPEAEPFCADADALGDAYWTSDATVIRYSFSKHFGECAAYGNNAEVRFGMEVSTVRSSRSGFDKADNEARRWSRRLTSASHRDDLPVLGVHTFSAMMLRSFSVPGLLQM